MSVLGVKVMSVLGVKMMSVLGVKVMIVLGVKMMSVLGIEMMNVLGVKMMSVKMAGAEAYVFPVAPHLPHMLRTSRPVRNQAHPSAHRVGVAGCASCFLYSSY
jgi:hypothetical protein